MNKNKDVKFYGYTQYPLIALNEFRKLNQFMIKKLKNVKCPALIIHSKSDRLSIKQNVDIIYNNVSSKKKTKFLVDNAHHNLFDKVTGSSEKLLINIAIILNKTNNFNIWCLYNKNQTT